MTITLITGTNKGLGYETARQLTGLIVRMATIGADGPTGTFQEDAVVLAW
jgi:NAD(P)-dependent dehydrogenase (short-subunit alcohol dehydrogenase family)